MKLSQENETSKYSSLKGVRNLGNLPRPPESWNYRRGDLPSRDPGSGLGRTGRSGFAPPSTPGGCVLTPNC